MKAISGSRFSGPDDLPPDKPARSRSGDRSYNKDIARSGEHPGNKRYLPSKPCVVCGRPMTWRKRWARSWESVRYCSEACRSRRSAR